MVQLASTLVALGVFCLSTAKRTEIASRLAALGVQPAQLEQLDAYIRESEPNAGQARRYLAAIIGDEAKLRDALDGLRAHLTARAPTKREGPPHVPNLPLGATGCRCAHCEGYRSRMPQAQPWDHDEQSMKVKAMIDGDRKSIAWVAELLAVHESTVESMLARGRVLLQRRDPPAPRLLKTKGKPAVEETPEQLKARVREFVRAQSKAVTP